MERTSGSFGQAFLQEVWPAICLGDENLDPHFAARQTRERHRRYRVIGSPEPRTVPVVSRLVINCVVGHGAKKLLLSGNTL